MTVVVDTSVLVDHLRGRAEAREVLAGIVRHGEAVAASVLTRTELLAGMRASEKEATTSLMGALEWIPVTPEIADRAGAWARQYLRSHASINIADYVIAASAESMGGRFLTRNVKHFPLFPGLSAPY